MPETPIEWTKVPGYDGHAINPIRSRVEGAARFRGHYCEKISPGCKNCYSSRLQPRFGNPTFSEQRRHAVEHCLDQTKLDEVLRRRKPTAYFWCDMMDIFGHWVSDDWLHQCLAVMALTPQHIHMVLTKRANRAFHFLADKNNEHWPMVEGYAQRIHFEQTGKDPSMWLSVKFPIPNVWVGVSAEDRSTYLNRVQYLTQLAFNGWTTFVSMEPLLDDLGDLMLDGIFERAYKWGIIGFESGPRARPGDIQWIRNILSQFRAGAVAPFVKQFGAHPVYREANIQTQLGAVKPLKLNSRKGSDPDEWPADLRIREFPVTI